VRRSPYAYSFPVSFSNKTILEPRNSSSCKQNKWNHKGAATDPGDGFIAVDGVSTADDASIQGFIQTFFQTQCSDPNCTRAWEQPSSAVPRYSRAIGQGAGDKYSYADLDDFSDLIARTVKVRRKRPRWKGEGYCRRWFILNTRRIGSLRTASNQPRFGSVLTARTHAPGGAFETGQQEIIPPFRSIRKHRREGNVRCVGLIGRRAQSIFVT